MPDELRSPIKHHLVLHRIDPAEGEAYIRTVVDTARLNPGTNAFKTILQTVSA